VLGIDRDPAALAAARERFDADHVTVVRGNFRDIGTLAPANGFDRVDGVQAGAGGRGSLSSDSAPRTASPTRITELFGDTSDPDPLADDDDDDFDVPSFLK
jgi:hypothetical protein